MLFKKGGILYMLGFIFTILKQSQQKKKSRPNKHQMDITFKLYLKSKSFSCVSKHPLSIYICFGINKICLLILNSFITQCHLTKPFQKLVDLLFSNDWRSLYLFNLFRRNRYTFSDILLKK